jgi:hypothetical protein
MVAAVWWTTWLPAAWYGIAFAPFRVREWWPVMQAAFIAALIHHLGAVGVISRRLRRRWKAQGLSEKIGAIARLTSFAAVVVFITYGIYRGSFAPSPVRENPEPFQLASLVVLALLALVFAASAFRFAFRLLCRLGDRSRLMSLDQPDATLKIDEVLRTLSALCRPASRITGMRRVRERRLLAFSQHADRLLCNLSQAIERDFKTLAPALSLDDWQNWRFRGLPFRRPRRLGGCRRHGLGSIDDHWHEDVRRWYRASARRDYGLARWSQTDFLDELTHPCATSETTG